MYLGEKWRHNFNIQQYNLWNDKSAIYNINKFCTHFEKGINAVINLKFSSTFNITFLLFVVLCTKHILHKMEHTKKQKCQLMPHAGLFTLILVIMHCFTSWYDEHIFETCNIFWGILLLQMSCLFLNTKIYMKPHIPGMDHVFRVLSKNSINNQKLLWKITLI